jgi:hypothetical protein
VYIFSILCCWRAFSGKACAYLVFALPSPPPLWFTRRIDAVQELALVSPALPCGSFLCPSCFSGASVVQFFLPHASLPSAIFSFSSLSIWSEAQLGDKFLKNVAMGENDADVIQALGEILVERFGAVQR